MSWKSLWDEVLGPFRLCLRVAKETYGGTLFFLGCAVAYSLGVHVVHTFLAATNP